MNRTATAVKPISKKQYEDALQRYSANSQLSTAIVAKSEKRIADEMKARHEKLGNVPQEMAKDFAIVQQYCEENRAKLFGEEKSVETGVGILAFRTNPHSVLLDDGVKDKDIVAALKKRGLLIYISTKESLDKKKLISDREDAKLMKVLEGAGASIEQTESFSITLNA